MGDDRGRQPVASMWAMVSVTETGHRGLLLISPCDLRQDTDSSGGSDSRARAIPGTRENDCKSLPASRPSAEANQGPLRLSPQLPQGKDCGLASLQYSQCQAHAPKHLPHTLHTPATHQPHDIHRPTTPLHTPSTRPAHTNHTPSTCHHILPKCLPHAICRPPTYLLHVFHTQTTCYFHAIHHLRCAIHTHLHARHPCAQPLLPNENQAPTWNPKDSPAPPGPRASCFHEDTLPSPMAPPAPHLCRYSPPG